MSCHDIRRHTAQVKTVEKEEGSLAALPKYFIHLFTSCAIGRNDTPHWTIKTLEDVITHIQVRKNFVCITSY